jgi:cyclopropane fatty-acyl-phospholipid synthase-like methyltransferase
MTTRLKLEQDYWNTAALDPEVEKKYICDLSTIECLVELGELKEKVLEIGCGIGRLMPNKSYGIDISKRMLNIAKQNRPDCYFKITKGDIPYPNNQFNTVYSMLVFQHITQDEMLFYFQEVYRVLREGGLFKFQFVEGSEKEPFSQHYFTVEIFGWLKELNFKDIKFTRSNIHESWVWAEATR